MIEFVVSASIFTDERILINLEILKALEVDFNDSILAI